MSEGQVPVVHRSRAEWLAGEGHAALVRRGRLVDLVEESGPESVRGTGRGWQGRV